MEYIKGQRVRLKSNPDLIGTIVKPGNIRGGTQWYKIHLESTNNIKSFAEYDLELHVGGSDVESVFKSGRFGSKSSFSKLLTFTKLTTSIRNNIYSIFSSKTEFHAYQYKPLLKYMDSVDKRLLIADEVGLGKTIETGLIIIEERVRNPLDRILIICPSSLTIKWRDEMKIRFDEEFEIMKSQRFSEFCEEYERDGNSVRLRAITSLATIRSKKNLELINNLQPSLDLVVVDEAHHMRNQTTKSYKLGLSLSTLADSMILLTATPINLGNQDLFNLLSILNQEEYDDYSLFVRKLEINKSIVEVETEIVKNNPNIDLCISELNKLRHSEEKDRFINNPIYNEVLDRLSKLDIKDRQTLVKIQHDIASLNMTGHIITRTKKRDVQEDIAQRTAQVVLHEFTYEEMKFYEKVTEFVRDNTEYGFYAFVVINYQRQVASCIQAMIKKYESKFNFIPFEEFPEESDQEIEDWENIKEEDYSKNHKHISNIISNIPIPKGIDSKYDALLKLLKELDTKEPNRKILLFSYFVGTLDYLEKRLEKDGYTNVVIHGKYDPFERFDRIEQFKKDRNLRIMLSSEVGSEGLDFQFCHILINYDLPWNPMKVEQRIGRLDRFGQESERILIFNIITKGTIEERILQRLYDRINIFEESIGDLEPILGEMMGNLQRELLTSKLTIDEQKSKIMKTADIVVRKRLQQEQLEKESGKLIGFDEYFEQELNLITKNKRFITAKEIEIFVRDYLINTHPKSKLSKTNNDRVFSFYITEELIDDVRKDNFESDPCLRDFIMKYSSNDNKIEVTFDSEEANTNKNLEFININHPLIKCIQRYYGRNRNLLHPIAKILIQSESFPKGEYYYFVYLLEFNGAKPEKRIEYILYDKNTNHLLDKELTEYIMAEAKTNGVDYEYGNFSDLEELNEIFSIVEDKMYSYYDNHKSELEKVNESRINDRLVSLENSYQLKISKAEQRLKKAMDDRIIRMNKGRINNLNSELDYKISKVLEGKDLGGNLEEIAAGYIIIK